MVDDFWDLDDLLNNNRDLDSSVDNLFYLFNQRNDDVVHSFDFFNLNNCNELFLDGLDLLDSSDFIGNLNDLLDDLRNLNNLLNCIVDDDNFLSDDLNWLDNFVCDWNWLVKVDVLLLEF